MIINVTQPILDYEGNPTQKGEGVFTIRNAIEQALNTFLKGAPPMTEEDKAKCYQISMKVWARKEVNLTVDDMSFIKKRSGQIHNPITYGRLKDLFDKPEDGKQYEENGQGTQTDN